MEDEGAMQKKPRATKFSENSTTEAENFRIQERKNLRFSISPQRVNGILRNFRDQWYM
jgi:hypothetical protein